eukprot:gene14901-16445_t
MLPNSVQKKQARVRHISLPTLFEGSNDGASNGRDNSLDTEMIFWTRKSSYSKMIEQDRNGKLPEIPNSKLQKCEENEEDPRGFRVARPIIRSKTMDRFLSGETGLNNNIIRESTLEDAMLTDKCVDENNNDILSCTAVDDEESVFINDSKRNGIIKESLKKTRSDPLLTRRKFEVGKMNNVTEWVKAQALLQHENQTHFDEENNSCANYDYSYQSLPGIPCQNSVKKTFAANEDAFRRHSVTKTVLSPTGNLEDMKSCCPELQRTSNSGFVERGPTEMQTRRGNHWKINENCENGSEEHTRSTSKWQGGDNRKAILEKEIKLDKLIKHSSSTTTATTKPLLNSRVKFRRHSIQDIITRSDSPFPKHQQYGKGEIITTDKLLRSRKIKMPHGESDANFRGAFSWPGSSSSLHAKSHNHHHNHNQKTVIKDNNNDTSAERLSTVLRRPQTTNS